MTNTFNPRDDKDLKSVYVYKNDKLMTMNHDYVIENSSGSRLVFPGEVKPDVGDVIKVVPHDPKQPHGYCYVTR